MADLYVDVDALNELSRQLGQVKASLERASDDVSAYDSRLGSSRIEGALDDFVGGWRDGRKKIIEGIDGLLGRIQGAIDTYNEQEAKLAEATRTGG
ncbi:MAG: hypothetical protein ACRD0K_13620 [Egibacteraceae bacterium]